MNAAVATPKYSEKLLLAILAAVQFTHTMDFMIMMPLEPKFARAFDISSKQFGVLVAAYSFSAGIAGFAAGFLLDRFDRKKALTLLYAGFMLGTLACSFAPNFASLLAARIIAGAFGGVASSVVMAIVGDVIPAERRGRAMGVVMTAFSMASFLGLPVGLVLADRFGWHAPFQLIVALGFAVFLGIRKVLPELPPHPHDHTVGAWRRMGIILTHANHLRAYTAIVALTAAGFLIYPFLSPSMVSNAGLPETSLPLIYLFGGAATFFSSPFFGKLSDRYGKARVFSVIALISAIPTLIGTHLTPIPTWGVLLVTTAFLVFASGRFVPLMALITQAVEPKYRGAFMSVNSAIQQIAAGLAATIAGWLVTTNKITGRLEGYGLNGWLACGALLLCIPLAFRLHRAVGVPKSTPTPSEPIFHE